MSWQPGNLLELNTERFQLRSMTREDVTETFTDWLADPEVMVGLNMPRKRLTRPQAVRWVLNNDNRTHFIILVIDRENQHPVGFFTITINGAHLYAETAVVIGDHDYWGKNVVIETRTALLDFLFEDIGLFKVIGRPHGRNFSSIYNYKAMGFTCEAIMRKQMRSIEGDGRLDQLTFGILQSEWRERKKGSAT